jgi:hypothetical protein
LYHRQVISIDVSEQDMTINQQQEENNEKNTHKYFSSKDTSYTWLPPVHSHTEWDETSERI